MSQQRISEAITGWYSNMLHSSSNESLRETFDQAKATFSTELTHDECKRIWIANQTSFQDFSNVLADTRRLYDDKPTSKAREWLCSFSSKITYYGNILDVLVQHHPEYVSLAWGTFKFLFIAIINHEESLAQLSKALSQLADVLPRTELCLVLYPTQAMMDSVALLYGHIMRFTQRAVVWYGKGKLRHCWDAIARPWALRFQEELQEIERLSKQMDNLANAASKAELRDVHIELKKTREDLLDLSRGHDRIITSCNQNFTQLLEFAINNKTLQAEIHADLHHQRGMLHEIQLGQVLSISFMQKLPSSGESLGYCQSMRSRRRQRTRLRLPAISTLHQWASESKSSLLLMQSSSKQASKDFMVDMINLIRETELPILWAMRFVDYWKVEILWVDILRALVLQAIQINPQALMNGVYPLKIRHLREASDELDWLLILQRALQGVERIFIILDADLIGHATAGDKYTATKCLEMLNQKLTSTNTKIFITKSVVQEAYVREHWDPGSWSNLQISNIGGTFQRRKQRKKRL